MDMENGTYMYSYPCSVNQECHVPSEPVSSQPKRGDHIARKGCYRLCWHHAIVENYEEGEGMIMVIEYSNSAKGFSQDNSSLPKDPGKAKVMRGEYRLDGGWYLIKHEKCLPANTVVSKAISRLGNKNYHLSQNNCEHFAMWCKTGIPWSKQAQTYSTEYEFEGFVDGYGYLGRAGTWDSRLLPC